ncbi:Cytidine deaminase [Toxocara canis]|uniref:Cytidine deaminase n=1 Tax=Toxocara canis TaxID=6265 RepID=A0A0B2UW17_TOXCA|nr:Cytidine deaminase [Toxocara canis]
MTIDANALVNAAKRAMEKAYCPYSKFRVGAALLTKDGTVITGGNVENASYGGTICAERSAVVRAVAEGHTEFKAIAVAGATAEPISPCGICRQFLVEFGNMQVIMSSTLTNKRTEMPLSKLLPNAFTPKSLNE